MKGAISLILADDHALVRDALARRLDQETDLEVLGVAADAGEATALALSLKPTVVLLDIDMPGMSAFEAASDIRNGSPETRVAFLSGHCRDCYIEQALAAEAAGYITKQEHPEVIADAVRIIAGGRLYFSAEVQSRLVVDTTGPRLADEPLTRTSLLTAREIETLGYIAQGMSKKAMARTMNISVKTVEQHCAHLMQKLDIHDRVELTRFAIREGVIEP